MDRILYDELLEEVLCRLPPPRATLSPSTADVSLVSKWWHRLYRSSRSRLNLCLFPNNCTPPSLSSFLSQLTHLSFLHIIDGVSSNFPDQILLSVASSCPNLIDLDFLQSDPHLRHRLGNKSVSVFPLFSLSTSCPHLTSLTIALSRPFFFHSLSFHWLLSFHSFRELDLCLDSVSISGEFDASSKGNFKDGAELKLETLTFSGILRGDRGFDGLWKSCKKLKKMRLDGCEGIGDDTAVSSFSNCLKGLQEVELRHCGSLVNDVLAILVEDGTSLNSLVIHDYDQVGREGLLHFITHTRCELRKLNLYLYSLGNNHLLAVDEKFRGLLSLRLDNCDFETNEGLTSMAVAMSNELEEFALIACNLKPELLTTLGQSFINLRKLDLPHNVELVDKEFTSMLVSFNCLRELSVRRCQGLTNASLVSMFKSCKQLEIEDILDCPEIDAEAVEFFVLNCLPLRQIHVDESKLSDVSRSWAKEAKGTFIWSYQRCKTYYGTAKGHYWVPHESCSKMHFQGGDCYRFYW